MHKSLQKMDSLPELQAYQDHPKQMKAAARGKVGVLELDFERKNDKTVLTHLYRVTPLLVQQALYWDESWPSLPICSIISVGGGILQGDRYYLEVNVKDNAYACVNTQSATRVQEMDTNYATQYQHIEVGKNAYLEYIPDSTILYKHSRSAFENTIIADPSSVVLYGETIMLGRKYYHNERFEFDVFSSAVNVYRPNGDCVFSEKLLLNEDDPTKNFNAVMQHFDVFANVVCVCPPDMQQKIVENYVFSHDKTLNVLAGVSQLPNQTGMVLRVVGQESYHVHAEIKCFTKLVRNLVQTGMYSL